MKYKIEISDKELSEISPQGNLGEIKGMISKFNSAEEETQCVIMALIITEAIIDELSSPFPTSSIN